MDYSLEKKKLPKPTTPVKRAIAPARGSPAPSPKSASAKPKDSNLPTKAVSKKPEGKKYTEEDIQELLSDGYINVHPSLWDYIPNGSHIRYVKKDLDNKGISRADRFKPGGFVKNHFSTDDGKKMFMIETKIGGKNGEPGYLTFPLAYESVEELWKKYDKYAFIEVHLIYTSLAQKKRQIEELTSRVKKLEAMLNK